MCETDSVRSSVTNVELSIAVVAIHPLSVVLRCACLLACLLYYGTTMSASRAVDGNGDDSLSSHQTLLSSILSYLSALKQSPYASSLLVSIDSLDAAVDCLSEATGLPRPAATLDTAQPSLDAIYEAGVAQLRTAEQSNSASAAATTTSSSSSSHDSSSAAPFSQFVSLLTDRGFFAGLQPGSAQYSDRMKAARQKYDDKYASKDTSSTSNTGNSSAGRVSDSDRLSADELKAEGNAYLSSQQYELAVKRYTSAIELNPHSAIYYGNRAAAYINLSEWSKAERDCRDAITIDQQYGKGQPQLPLTMRRQPTHTLATTDAICRALIPPLCSAAVRSWCCGSALSVGSVFDVAGSESGGRRSLRGRCEVHRCEYESDDRRAVGSGPASSAR